MKKYPYIEPTIRTIAGALVTTSGVMLYLRPEMTMLWLGLLFFVSLNLFQSGLTRFCLMEKILKHLGFRSELDEIRHMALHDALTGLPNRLLLEDRTEMAIAHARRTGDKVAMLFLDVDNFKQVNDIHGHKAGDRLLIKLSKILHSNLRQGDTLARWGGDEFVVLLPDLVSTADACEVAEKFMNAIRHEVDDGRLDNSATLSIGIALFPDDADNCETLLVQADKALFFSKSQGRNNIQLFSDLRAAKTGFWDFELTARFAAIVRQRLIQVHYQPLIDARSGKPICVEALARWNDSKNGWVSPGIFIPMAENLGLIHEVGQQVLERALEDFGQCPAKSIVRLAINLSGRQLLAKDFVPNLERLLARHQLGRESLKLEITESVALGSGEAQKRLRELSEAGFYISLDDFGTGFSSLSLLHEIPVDELKIDISFVRNLKTREGRAMVKAIIDIAKALDLELVGEGVEDKKSADTLRAMGVTTLQGYYFCRPMPKEQCVRYVTGGIQTPRRAMKPPRLSVVTGKK